MVSLIYTLHSHHFYAQVPGVKVTSSRNPNLMKETHTLDIPDDILAVISNGAAGSSSAEGSAAGADSAEGSTAGDDSTAME